ncbi:hypothetical protein CC85DRAFT_288455 [Cutaneotrichosporon oleaginosum]|uniref:Uncharacterized protein n=1 Tax=Cutaneotrichosporon oleaginosum TaxID=879819 RepID=A0A0J0XEQ1_9TREE|nr:uncharacterized protein CC85DRAFT_288455 [Cutaneotrichosporon oleaginosum]KLT39541.1 hypothetical protein CC85DRAFT_288455 [Cutaneotrichosporon oleaginosum]TXT07060.1 hypothetical protein COLE_06391 [Cutaneotrichosporon oleaginosum]
MTPCTVHSWPRYQTAYFHPDFHPSTACLYSARPLSACPTPRPVNRDKHAPGAGSSGRGKPEA